MTDKTQQPEIADDDWLEEEDDKGASSASDAGRTPPPPSVSRPPPLPPRMGSSLPPGSANGPPPSPTPSAIPPAVAPAATPTPSVVPPRAASAFPPTSLFARAPTVPPRPTPSVAPRPSWTPGGVKLPGTPAGAPTPAPPSVMPPGGLTHSSGDAPPVSVTPPTVATGTMPPAAPYAEQARLQTQLLETRRLLGLRDEELKAAAGRHDARVAQLEASHRTEKARIEARIAELEASLAAREEAVKKLEAEVADLRSGKAEAGGGGLVGDDLKKIRGVGPTFEKALKNLGVTTFAQIAAWKPEDLEAIAPKIKARAERIRREGWVTSAAELAGAAVSAG